MSSLLWATQEACEILKSILGWPDANNYSTSIKFSHKSYWWFAGVDEGEREGKTRKMWEANSGRIDIKSRYSFNIAQIYYFLPFLKLFFI